MVKRTLDIVFSLLVLMAATPLFMLIGILVKLDSRGPVFYRGVRVGRLGNPFRMYKFRTIEMDPGFRTGS